MQVLPLSLTSESDQRVYVDVYPLPNGVGRRQRDDAVADTRRPAQVAADVHLNPGRGTRRIVGEGRGGVDDRGLSPDACKTTETLSVAAPSAARSYRRLSGRKNDVEKFGIRIPRGAFGDRCSINPETMGLPSNHAVPVYSVLRDSPPAASRTSVSMRGCGSTSIIVIVRFWRRWPPK
jgi:hypothetical protein